jgi:hypothetical protein
MNCHEARKWISPYLDSELGKTKTFEVSEHLRHCPACAARFDQERQADMLVRSRIQQTAMPQELWLRIARDLTTPRWIRLLRHPATLATAACLALVLGGLALFLGGPARATPGVVRDFVALRPDDVPFVRPEGHPPPRLAQALRDRLGVAVELAVSPDVLARHDMECVEVNTRVDSQGRSYLEIRLNCCGQPILLVLGESTGGQWPSVFQGISPAGEPTLQHFDDINLASVDLGGVRAVAVSRHPVAALVEGLHVQST